MRRCSYHERPVESAADLVRMSGWEHAVAQTVDVHMSAWIVVTVVGGRTERPHLGRWRVTAHLAGRASGDTVRAVDFTER